MKIINTLKDNEYNFTKISEIREIARCVLLNDEKEVALLKIDGYDDDFGLRDYYELPGGGVEKGESLKDALKREMIEETGYKIKNIREIGTVIDYYNSIERENHNNYFLAYIDIFQGTKYTKLEQELISKLLFVKLDDAINIFEKMTNGKIASLVKRRELPILKIAKEMIEKGDISL